MSIAEAFTRTAADYDAPRRQLVPCFDALYGVALERLPFGPDDAPRIVDLGAGSGLLSALILDKLPKARLHLIDVSEGMLGRARERFEGDDRVTFEIADLTKADLPTAEAFVSALAIHHLEDADKRALFGRIFRALRPGGVFVTIDQTAEPEAVHRNWLAAVRATGIDAIYVDQALERMKLDRNAPVDDQLAWMGTAGFTEVTLHFRQWFFVAYSGRKP